MGSNKKAIRTIVILILFAILVYAAVQNFDSVLGAVKKVYSVFSTVIAGACIAFILNILLVPIEDKLFGFLKRSKRPFFHKLCRPISLLVTLILALGIIAVSLLVILPELVETLLMLFDGLPDYLNAAIKWAEDKMASFNIAADALPNFTIDWEAAMAKASDFVTGGLEKIINAATNITTSVVTGVFGALFSLFLSVYILAKKEKVESFMYDFLHSFFPQKFTDRAIKVAKLSNEVFSNFVRCQCLECVILGVMCFVGMLIFKFPYPTVISITIAITALVPQVGTFIGELVSVLLILVIDPVRALLFIVFILCLQWIETSIIYPKVVGKSVGLPAVLVLSAVLIGMNLSGVLGALLATPVCAILYALIKETMGMRRKRSIETPIETDTIDTTAKENVEQ